ncbi:caspase family protein [Thermomonospora umbrina]|uniref:Caspase domain-containing protein n=1 Tax=Thermomonospora umbrina TaxID=111806 RepID=A0A3D9SXW3_9ACTN|nr:caspase family protein [Thermomonospora umbrina]REF00803.1 caspase domain-containing protein [Thermomonospora umbrina]
MSLHDMRPRQADPVRSRAVLIGTHTYEHESLPALPAVEHNLLELQRALTDPAIWGLPAQNCAVVSQKKDAAEILDIIQRAGEQATDTLLVYYAGHGLMGTREGQLWLTLPHSRARKHATVLHYDWIADVLRNSHAKWKTVILDCCYSGQAFAGNTLGPSEFADWAQVRGSFVMTSAAQDALAGAPFRDRPTVFTGALLSVLDNGIPNGPPLLDMATVFAAVRGRLVADNHPIPQQGNQDMGGSSIIFRNRWHGAPARADTALDASSADLNGWGVPDPAEGWKWQADAFRWGPFRAPLIIVEGDGTSVIGEDSVRLIVQDDPIELPDELAEWRAEIERDQRERRERGDDFFWNGNRYAIDKVSVSRHPTTESPEVSLRLKPSDYYSFLAVQQHDREFADGTTPRSRYLDPYRPVDVPAFMSSSLGTNIAVVTADNKMIFSRRSQNVGSHPGHWNSSANEALSRDIDSQARNAPNLYDVARRGLREELGLERHEYRLSLLAITVDRRNQWGALFTARLTSLTSDQFLARRSRGVADKYEHDEHALVPFEVADIVEFMFCEERRTLWAATAPAVFFLALVYQYGRTVVEDESLRTFARLRARER